MRLELWLLPRVCDIPRIHLGVPPPVELSALDADGYRHVLPYLNGELVYLVPEEREADLLWVLSASVEDIALLLPRLTCLARALLEREDAVDAP